MLDKRVIPSLEVLEMGETITHFGAVIKAYFDEHEPDIDAIAYIQYLGVAVESMGVRLCNTAMDISKTEEELIRLRTAQAETPKTKR